MLILFLLCVLGVWIFWAYHYVIDKRDAAFEAFEQVDKELKKRYELILNIISATKNNMMKEQSLIDYILKLRKEVIDLGLNPDFMDRRMALDAELERKSAQFISIVKKDFALISNYELENVVQKYSDLCDEITLAKRDYNDAAKVLRKAVLVFPTSLIARLSRIKFLDYMK